ncbi:9190_t:CDS:1, partial [Paraglomus occultum]
GNDGLTPDEKTDINNAAGDTDGVYNPDDIQYAEGPYRRKRTDVLRESDDENLIDDDDVELNLNKSQKPSRISAIAGFAGGLFTKKNKTNEIEGMEYESTKTEKDSETIITGFGAGNGGGSEEKNPSMFVTSVGGGGSEEKNTSTFVADGEDPNNFIGIAGAGVQSKKEKSGKFFGLFGRKDKKSTSTAAGVIGGSAAVGAV